MVALKLFSFSLKSDIEVTSDSLFRREYVSS